MEIVTDNWDPQFTPIIGPATVIELLNYKGPDTVFSISQDSIRAACLIAAKYILTENETLDA